jgi:hypothetical protein
MGSGLGASTNIIISKKYTNIPIYFVHVLDKIPP